MNAMPSMQLPLQGSNLDSPDPESGEARPFRGVAAAISGGNTPEARPKPHENPHDFTHGRSVRPSGKRAEGWV